MVFFDPDILKYISDGDYRACLKIILGKGVCLMLQR